MPTKSLRPAAVQLKASTVTAKPAATAITKAPATKAPVVASATKQTSVSSGGAATPVAKATQATPAGTAVKAVAAKDKVSAATAKDKVSGTGTAIQPGDMFIQPGDIVAVPPVYTINEFTRRIVRPRDLLVLDFTFVNLKVRQSSGGPELVRNNTTKPSYVVIGFPAQHLHERAFFENEGDTGSDKPKDTDIPVASRLSDPSRLVFRIPTNFTAIPYTLEELLKACATYELSVAPTATPPESNLRYELDMGVAEATLKIAQPAIKAAAVKARAPASRSAAARSVAAQAYTAAVSAEVQNQWFAKRDPLIRAGLVATEVDTAVAKVLPQLAPPTDTQTAIEAPTRLIISPNSYGAWVHAALPVESTQSGRVELWHTRLAVRRTNGVTEADDYRRTIRAIWSPDLKEDPFGFGDHPEPPTPFLATLDQFDRHNIVHLSANHRLYIPGPKPQKRHKPLPIDVDRLMLSSLGVWMNVHGAWDPPPPLAVESWRHRATMGRDHYVRVVYAGALYPFGHRASLIKVTERKFHSDRKGNAAFLRQRMFIVVREPYRLLGNTGLVNDAGESLDRKMPLKSARITTLVTPNLDYPADPKCIVLPAKPGQGLFWPHVSGKPFLFHVQFADASGALIDVAMPLFFLGNENLEAATRLVKASVGDPVATRYTTFADFSKHRRVPFNGQRVQLAPTAKPGDTSFELSQLEFCLAFKNGRLIPGMGSAAASIPTLKHLARSNDLPEVKFPPVFLKSGFPGTGSDANKGQVFLELLDANSTKMNLGAQGDRAGALLAPNIAISGLSRSLGPIGGGIEKMAKTGFDPNDFFGNLGDMLPKLFGCIKITDILDVLNFNSGGFSLDKLPRFMSENLTAAQGLIDDVGRVQALLGTLSGQLPGLGAQATALGNACAALVTRLSALLGDPLNDAKRDSFKAGFGDLSQAAGSLRNGFGGLAVPEALQFSKTQLDQLLAKFSVGLEKAADIVAMADRIADSLEALNEQRIKFEWKPPIKNWGLEPGAPIFEIKPGGGLVIAVELSAQSGSSKEPSFDVACRLQKFDLNLIAPETFLKLHFNKIEFTASTRQKPDVNVDFGGIEFVGVLSFVETLRTLIPLDGFSDPPALTVSEQGIEASFSIGLPNIAVGVFSLQNLSLGAAFTVPFIGAEPLSVRFNFCERSDPFRLTVWIFGGGGFFAVTVTPAGVQLLEAAFEFGACASLDFGVASGSVSVMAGIYFRMEADDASLTGYLNLKGRVSVLGLITASLELALELTYEFASGKCVGRATMIIEVEVLFFSASVEVSCEKKVAGSNGDPSFVQIMAPYEDPVTGDKVEPWAEYAGAFAA